MKEEEGIFLKESCMGSHNKTLGEKREVRWQRRKERGKKEAGSRGRRFS
jgi:hypothetical protein